MKIWSQSANVNVLYCERKIYKYVITFNFNSYFNFSDINKILSILRIKYCLFICIHDQYYVCQYVWVSMYETVDYLMFL